MKHYNQSTPPQYHLSDLPKTLPIALFTGGNDYLADPQDVAILVSQLPVPPVATVHVDNYSHTGNAFLFRMHSFLILCVRA